MKLSAYAEKPGISYKTAWRWWKEPSPDQRLTTLFKGGMVMSKDKKMAMETMS
jgi:hypothetical protein